MGKKNTEEALADETDQLVHQILEQGVDCVVGGFPCQDISVNGNKKGMLKDSAGDAITRSGLFWEMVRTVCLVRPKYWLMENVAELLDGHLGVLLPAVAECGYDAEWDCVSASSVGAPHHRGRIYILAYPAGTRGSRLFPESIQRQPEFSRYENCRGVEDILRVSAVSEPLLSRGANGVAKRLHGIGNGNPPCVIREIMKSINQANGTKGSGAGE